MTLTLFELGRFHHPKLTTPERLALPQTSADLDRLLDSGKLSKNDIEALIRNRYPETAKILDRRLFDAQNAYRNKPDEHTWSCLTKTIGMIGAFNYIRGVEVLRWDGSIDRDIAHHGIITSSTAIQVLDIVNLSKRDSVLELFSGVGYFSFFLALSEPLVVDCLDNYTPTIYDLNSTFDRALQWVYSDLPGMLKPSLTRPNFMQADCARLPDFEKNPNFQDHYEKVFLHPPYGRESSQLFNLTEGEAFILWLRSLLSLHSSNKKGDFITYSVIPSEWTKTVTEDLERQGLDLSDTITRLYERLQNNPYYHRHHLKIPANAENINSDQWELLLSMFEGSIAIPVRETRTFDLSIHVTKTI